MSPPSTVREALLAEMYGDTLQLVEKVDGLKAALPALVDQLCERIETAGRSGNRSLEAASKDAARMLQGVVREQVTALEAERGKWKTDIEAVTREARFAAAVVQSTGRKFWIMSLFVGGSAGLVGGVLAGLAISRAIL